MLRTSGFAIVLAAGSSRRMGTCKAALPWGDSHTLLSYQIEQWLQVEISPIIVLGPHNAAALQSQLLGQIALINPFPAAGKTGSIRIGMSQIPADAELVCISAVDQPRSAGVYQRLLKQHRTQQCAITTPTYQGRRGHPLVLGQKVIPALSTLQEETQGLRQVVDDWSSSLFTLEFETPQVLIDLNTPEQYQFNLRGMRDQ